MRLDLLMGPESLTNTNMLFMGQFELWLNNRCLWLVGACGHVSSSDLRYIKSKINMILLDFK